MLGKVFRKSLKLSFESILPHMIMFACGRVDIAGSYCSAALNEDPRASESPSTIPLVLVVSPNRRQLSNSCIIILHNSMPELVSASIHVSAINARKRLTGLDGPTHMAGICRHLDTGILGTQNPRAGW